MKKISLILLCFLAFASSTQAQIFSQKRVQLRANDQLAYVFGYLKSDDMTFKNLVLPDPETKVVLMHDAFGRPLYVLMTNSMFDSTNAQIARMPVDSAGRSIGLEFNLTYLSSFSWQSRKSIKNISNKQQKAITKVLNSKVKYCLMQQGSQAVYGVRITDKSSEYYGQIVPDFSGSTVVVKQVATPIGLPGGKMEIKPPVPVTDTAKAKINPVKTNKRAFD